MPAVHSLKRLTAKPSLSMSSRLSASPLQLRTLSSRAFVYKQPGDPSQVLECVEFELPELQRGQLALSHKLASINPADINLIEGRYPAKAFQDQHTGHFFPGNEGLATVESVHWGQPSDAVSVGDWVMFSRPQCGTWRSRSIVSEQDIIKLDRHNDAPYPLTEEQAAQLYINPATAYRMLRDFVDLSPGDWVIQNGANSAVGVNVIQIAKAWGLKTVNIVRDREHLGPLKDYLHRLGATEIITEAELKDSSFKSRISDWTGHALPKLALNSVSGQIATNMAKHLAQGGTIVTYGGMSKQPLSLPSGFLIFKDLQAKGFCETISPFLATSELTRTPRAFEVVSASIERRTRHHV